MEKILDKRISSKDGKLEYLIAWENFGPEDNTWEPQSNIFCPVMLKNFEERRAAEKRSKKNGRNLELVSKELNHLAAILHVCAGV